MESWGKRVGGGETGTFSDKLIPGIEADGSRGHIAPDAGGRLNPSP